jgi:hypothetical protein
LSLIMARRVSVNMENCPRWLDLFIKLVRPGVMVSMFALLVFGGLGFSMVEFFFPDRGDAAVSLFVKFLMAVPDEYYETLRFMFGAYVVGRSGQAIAESYAEAKKVEAVSKAKATSNEPVG